MNNLLSGSFSRVGEQSMAGSVQMTTGANLDKFFGDVEGVKEELREIERIHRRLHESNESGKILHNAKAVKDLRSAMDADLRDALKRSKIIKLRLESLDRSNAANRSQPGCGPGSSTDRTRTSVVAGLRKKLLDTMKSFNQLRDRISSDHKETVGRRYFTVTGEKPDERTVELLISTGESEIFLQKAIQEQGRGQILDAIAEIQERHGAVKELERSLVELQQVFLDMAVLVEAQGEQLNDIESQVNRASSFVREGTGQLQTARVHQKNTRKWTCFAIVLLLVIILVIVLPIVLKNSKNKN